MTGCGPAVSITREQFAAWQNWLLCSFRMLTQCQDYDPKRRLLLPRFDVDDISKKEHGPVSHREVAFTVTAGDFIQDTPMDPDRFRSLNDRGLQHFRDTRAHKVTYTLVASTNFREYYPGADNPKVNDPDFQREGKDSVTLTALCSARPLAPSILYLIPAFLWVDTYDPARKTWYAGRTVVMRVYVERPWLCSGDRETLGVVLFNPLPGVAPEKQNFVSRWGADPTRPITTPILNNEMSEANLCEADRPLENCMLAEGDKARIKPCTIQWSKERQLWFADIPIDTQRSNAPFVRLALVRWQPDALAGPGEARCSQVVFAEFMQVSPDRWVSVQKRSGSKYAITISGAFANQPLKNPFRLTLQARWYAVGRDTGWREVKSKSGPRFVNTPQDSTGVSTCRPNWRQSTRLMLSDTVSCSVKWSSQIRKAGHHFSCLSTFLSQPISSPGTLVRQPIHGIA